MSGELRADRKRGPTQTRSQHTTCSERDTHRMIGHRVSRIRRELWQCCPQVVWQRLCNMQRERAESDCSERTAPHANALLRTKNIESLAHRLDMHGASRHSHSHRLKNWPHFDRNHRALTVDGKAQHPHATHAPVPSSCMCMPHQTHARRHTHRRCHTWRKRPTTTLARQSNSLATVVNNMATVATQQREKESRDGGTHACTHTHTSCSSCTLVAATGSCIETGAPGATSHPRPESATESKAGAAPGSDDAIIFRRASVSLVAYIVPTHTPCAGAPTLLGDAVVPTGVTFLSFAWSAHTHFHLAHQAHAIIRRASSAEYDTFATGNQLVDQALAGGPTRCKGRFLTPAGQDTIEHNRQKSGH
jgi:hypothetical protein